MTASNVEVIHPSVAAKEDRHGTYHHDRHCCRVFPVSSESLSLVVQPRQRGTPRVRPDPGTAAVCESAEIPRPLTANTRGCPTLFRREPSPGQQDTDQCASPGGRVCSRLWCPDQSRRDIDVRET